MRLRHSRQQELLGILEVHCKYFQGIITPQALAEKILEIIQQEGLTVGAPLTQTYFHVALLSALGPARCANHPRLIRLAAHVADLIGAEILELPWIPREAIEEHVSHEEAA